MDVNPTSDVVVKTVARKLRHYIDVQRREQGFDLSGPKKPPNVLKRREFREGVSRSYHTHRDRRLKHSFAEARVKTHRDVDAESTASSSQSTVRIGLEEEMDRLARIKRTQRSRTWRRSSISSTGTPTSPPPPPHPTKKSGRAQSASPRKQQPLLFHRLSRGSAERLLSTASKLIVATEVVALTENFTDRRGSPDQVRLPTVDIDSWSRDDSPTKSRQDINLEDISGYYEEKDVSQKGNSSNNDQNETKSPPPPLEEQQPSSIRIKLNEASSQYTRSDSYLYRRATLDPLPSSSRGDSNDCEEKESTSKTETGVVVTAVASLTDVSEDERSDEKDETSNGQEEDEKEVTCDDNDTQEKSIEESDSEIHVMKSEETQTQTNEDEQEKNPIESSHQEVNIATGNGTSPQALSPTPSLSTSVAMVDSFTQTPNHKATQTANSFAVTPVRGEQEALTFSSPENVLQEASRVLQLLQNLPTRVEYQIEVHTGSEPLAGTTAKIFVNIYGEAGNSGPRELSRKNESYFQRNQVDIFTVSSSSLGKIKGLKVWHDNSGDAPDWFLEKIVLREGGNNSIADFLFECRKWLKSDSNQKPYEALYPTEIILKGVASSELEAVLLGSASSDSLRASATFYPSPAAAASSAATAAATSFQARNLLEEFSLGHDWQAESQPNRRRSEEGVKVETKDKDDEEQNERTRAERERLKKEEDENEREERAMRKAMEKIGEEARQKALIRHASAVKIQEFLKGFAAGSRALKADPKPIEEKLQEKIEDQEGEADVEEDEDDEDEDEEQQILSMLSAAKKGDAQKLESLLNRNSSLLKIKGEHGLSPLHEASLGGHTECVKFLVSCGANLYEFTPTGYAPIHLATMNGHIHCLQLLKGLGCGLSFRAVDDKTPLHLAAERGYIECCRWLIANRANLTAEDNSGRTPVALAEENDHDDCATLLRECGKELKRKSSGLALVLTPESSSAQSALRPMSGQQSKVQRKRTTSLGSASENDEDDEGWKSDENATPETRKEIKHSPGFSLEEKRSLYDRQQLMMRKQDSSFLDSIRNEVEDEVEEEQDSRTDKEEKERDGEHSSEEERD